MSSGVQVGGETAPLYSGPVGSTVRETAVEYLNNYYVPPVEEITRVIPLGGEPSMGMQATYGTGEVRSFEIGAVVSTSAMDRGDDSRCRRCGRSVDVTSSSSSTTRNSGRSSLSARSEDDYCHYCRRRRNSSTDWSHSQSSQTSSYLSDSQYDDRYTRDAHHRRKWKGGSADSADDFLDDSPRIVFCRCSRPHCAHCRPKRRSSRRPNRSTKNDISDHPRRSKRDISDPRNTSDRHTRSHPAPRRSQHRHHNRSGRGTARDPATSGRDLSDPARGDRSDPDPRRHHRDLSEPNARRDRDRRHRHHLDRHHRGGRDRERSDPLRRNRDRSDPARRERSDRGRRSRERSEAARRDRDRRPDPARRDRSDPARRDRSDPAQRRRRRNRSNDESPRGRGGRRYTGSSGDERGRDSLSASEEDYQRAGLILVVGREVGRDMDQALRRKLVRAAGLNERPQVTASSKGVAPRERTKSRKKTARRNKKEASKPIETQPKDAYEVVPTKQPLPSSSSRQISQVPPPPLLTHHYFHHYPDLPSHKVNPFPNKNAVPLQRHGQSLNDSQIHTMHHFPLADKEAANLKSAFPPNAPTANYPHDNLRISTFELVATEPLQSAVKRL